ncbi:MAG: TAXI family TRAP transporter solute-binding subunit [Candidatus Odyssella sp.]|nr:TAXI family TRAP transporter solute-binding subunit [Candidatus Odyssella sp.]
MRALCILLLALVAALHGAGPAAGQPANLTLGTARPGGTYVIYGGFVARLIAKEARIPVATRETDGPNDNIVLLSEKKIDIGMTTMGIAHQAWTASAPWTKGKKFREIRALFPMYDTPFHFVVLEKSDIRSVKDMARRKVGVGPKSGTPGTYFPMMFKTLGIAADFQFGGAAAMADQLIDGKIDAFAFAAGLPIDAFSMIEDERAVRFVRYTDQEIAAIRKALPELTEATIPRTTYRQLDGDHKTLGTFNFFVAHMDMIDSLAYRITKTVMEQSGLIVKGHASAKETVPENWDRNTFLPYHPGALKYFAEKGIKVPAHLRR